MGGEKKDDDLLKRAEALQESLDEADHSKLERRTGAFYSDWGGPLGGVLRALVRYVRWLAFEPVDDTVPPGRRFSAWRLLRNGLISLVALVLIHMTLKAAYFYGTAFEETVYVTGKQEIVTGELYQFGGCTSLPCSTRSDNGKFYLVESSLYFPVMFYPEEEVFANIPQQNGACKVEGYGIYFRLLRWFYKAAQLYQHVVNVSCRPYTEEEIRRAFDRESDQPGTELDVNDPGS